MPRHIGAYCPDRHPRGEMGDEFSVYLMYIDDELDPRHVVMSAAAVVSPHLLFAAYVSETTYYRFHLIDVVIISTVKRIATIEYLILAI